jgi:uncharacterized UBP type Zn finger protein
MHIHHQLIRFCAGLYANSSVEEQKVMDIMEMGFTKEQAQKALDMCGLDKQAAIEHILSGTQV